MVRKLFGTAIAAALALAACGTGRSDPATSAAAARSSTGMSSASPTMGGTPAVGGPVNQSATTVAPANPPMPMATGPVGSPSMGPSSMGAMPERRMSAAERRRMGREERRASRRGGSMSDRDRAYMGGGMVGSVGVGSRAYAPLPGEPTQPPPIGSRPGGGR